METKAGFMISQIKQLQDRIFERLLSQNQLDISGGQGRILFVLWKQDRQTISAISQATSLAKNTVSIVVDGMVAKGILNRSINPENRRQTLISLTDYAHSIQDQYDAISQTMNALFYEGFTEAEKDELEAKLQRILSNLQAIEKTGGQAGEKEN